MELRRRPRKRGQTSRAKSDDINESGYPARFRKRLGGASLIAAPLILAGGETLRLSTGTDEVELEIAGLTKETPGIWFAIGLLEVVALVLFFPALGALLHVFRRRAVALGHLAVGLLVVAFVFQTAYAVILAAANATAADVTQHGDARPSDIAVTLAYANAMELPLSLYRLISLIALVVGLLALSNAVWSSKLFPRWAALAIAVAALWLVLFEWGQLLLDVAPYVFLSIGLGGIGWRILALSTSEWEQIRGTSPLAAQERP